MDFLGSRCTTSEGTRIKLLHLVPYPITKIYINYSQRSQYDSYVPSYILAGFMCDALLHRSGPLHPSGILGHLIKHHLSLNDIGYGFSGSRAALESQFTFSPSDRCRALKSAVSDDPHRIMLFTDLIVTPRSFCNNCRMVSLLVMLRRWSIRKCSLTASLSGVAEYWTPERCHNRPT